MLAIIAFALAQAATPESAGNPGNLSEELFRASAMASGNRLCDRARAARYSNQFDARYGRRIRALVRYHEGKFGPDPEFIYVSSCLVLGGSYRQQERLHAKAMTRFEGALQEMERRYGPQNARDTNGSQPPFPVIPNPHQSSGKTRFDLLLFR